MPLPTPRSDEDQNGFVSRCHEAIAGEYPETDVRNGICFRQWREHRGGADAVERKAREKFGNEQFIRKNAIPVFAEHTTKDKEGNVVVYDKAALELIAQRCNERILDTGDFCPITDGHTPDEEQIANGAATPDILGFAGPYHLGMIGNKHPRWAIFQDEHWYKDDADKLMKKPRRSVELWAEDRMEDRFFDPVAALGAETPRLDLGLAYSRRQTRDGKFVTKYAAKPTRVKKYMGVACAPGATSVSPKRFGTKKKHASNPPPAAAPPAEVDQSSTGDQTAGGKLSMPITPDDCKTIVDAVESLDFIQEWKQMMPALKEMLDHHGGSPSGSVSVSGSSGSPSGSPSGTPSGGPTGSPSMSVSGSPSGGSPSGSSGSPSGFSPSGSPSKHAYSASGDPSGSPSFVPDDKHPSKNQPYAAGSPSGGSPSSPSGSPSRHGAIARDVSVKLSAGASGPSGPSEVPPGGAVIEKGKKYAASGSVSGNIKDLKEASAVGTITKTTGSTVASPSIMKMAKHKDKKDRYQRLKEQQRQTAAEVAELKREKRDAIRYARLGELKSDGYVFELAEELDETKDLTDDQFDKHIGRIKSRYAKAPVGERMLPTPQFREREGKPDKHEKALRDKVIELNDLQNREYDAAVKRGGKPPARKDFYQLQEEAKRLISSHGVTKTA